MVDPVSRVIHFGVFEVDLAARTLRKRGVRVKLQDQPFRLLTALLEKPGQIVTREEIQEKLWPDDTFVDFDKSLNTAAQKVRQALGDSAESPRFMETVPRQGYRWLAPLEPAGTPPPPAAETESRSGARRRFDLRPFRLGGVVALAVATMGFGYWLGRQETGPEERKLKKFTLSPELPVDTRAISEIKPSPDGRYIAFLRGTGPYATRADSDALVVWDARRDEYKTLGTGGRLFWYPNGRRIGRTSRDGVFVIDVESGDERPLVELGDESGMTSFWSGGGAWSPTGETIVFALGFSRSSLYQVGASGGEPEVIAEPTEEELGKGWRLFSPSFLPTVGGREAVLCTVGNFFTSGIGVVDLKTGLRRIIVPAGNLRLDRAVYSPSGHVLYEEFRERIWAIPFSLERLAVTGDPFIVAENAVEPGVGSDGTLTFGKRARIEPGERMQLGWRDRSGRKLGVIGEPQEVIGVPVLSPDGKEVVVQGRTNGVPDVWIHEVERPVKRRVTFQRSNNNRPTWLPSGKQVSFTDEGALWVAAADGSREPELLFDDANNKFGFEWSPDGRYLVGSGGSEIWYLHRGSNEGEWERVVLEDDSFDRVGPELSPDGRYIAYESSESGRPEIYVRPFPEGGWKRRISTSGGAKPRWQSDGEIFYVEGDALMVVPVSTEPEFSAGAPERLFTEEGLFAGRGQTYDVTADGQKIVVVEGRQTPWPREIQVVQNWYEEFRDRDE